MRALFLHVIDMIQIVAELFVSLGQRGVMFGTTGGGHSWSLSPVAAATL